MNPICNWVLFQCVYFSLHFTSFSSLMSLCLVTMSTTLVLFCLFSTLLPSPTPQLSHQVAAEVEPVRHPAPSINICLKIEKLSVDGELIAHNYVKIAAALSLAKRFFCHQPNQPRIYLFPKTWHAVHIYGQQDTKIRLSSLRNKDQRMPVDDFVQWNRCAGPSGSQRSLSPFISGLPCTWE